MAKVAIIGSGGTIASVGVDSLDLARYADTKQMYDVLELLEQVPELSRCAQIEPVEFKTIPSPRMTSADWVDLVELIHQLARRPDPPDGIVLTHGTATLEETAYFLHLTLKVDLPVVVVGAQRPMSGLSTDAKLNLVNAVRVAIAPEARGQGVLVVMNAQIHCARDVTKTHTYQLETFQSLGFGPLGYADPESVTIPRRAIRAHTLGTPFEVESAVSFPRVDIVTSYVDAGAEVIEALVQAGSQGIISAGFAPGFCTGLEKDALEAAAKAGVVVAQSIRSGTGRIAPMKSLRAEGALTAADLPPHKARILLMLAIHAGLQGDAIQDALDRY